MLFKRFGLCNVIMSILLLVAISSLTYASDIQNVSGHKKWNLNKDSESWKAKNPGTPSHINIADKYLNLRLDTRRHTYTLCDRRTRRVWKSADLRNFTILDARKESKSSLEISLLYRISQTKLKCKVSTANGNLVFSLAADGYDHSFSMMEYPPRFTTDMHNGALIFCSRSCGSLIDQTDKNFPIKTFVCYGNLVLDMPWMGAFDEKRGDGMMVLFETDADVALTLQSDKQGRYWPQTDWMPSMGCFKYPRKVSYRFSSGGGYVALAKMYRSYAKANGLLKTLSQKSKEKPRVEWLKGAPAFWGMDGLEGLQLAEEIHAAGIKHARICANGKFPAADIDLMTKMGYLTLEYDNYDDTLEGPLGNFESGNMEKDAFRTRDGKPVLGWFEPPSTQYFRRSSARALDAARAYVPSVLKEHPFTSRFLDVSSTVDLLEDYHPNHTFGRREDMNYRRDLFKYINKLGLVLGVEHGKSWNLDLPEFVEGAASGPFWWESGPIQYLRPMDSKNQIPADYLKYGINYAKLIPLRELVYHDCVVSTWWWGDVADTYYAVAPELANRKDLFNMLYGTVPLTWGHDRYPKYGWHNNRSRFLETYRNTCKLHEVIGFDTMISHEFLNSDRSVQRTKFSSGSEVVVNFSNKPQTYTYKGEQMLLAPGGFYAHAPGFRQSCLWKNNESETRIDGDGYHYFQTQSRRRIGPVELDGRLSVFRLDNNRWHICVEGGRECSISFSKLTGVDMRNGLQLFEIDEHGGRLKEIPVGSNGNLIIQPDKDLALYEVFIK